MTRRQQGLYRGFVPIGVAGSYMIEEIRKAGGRATLEVTIVVGEATRVLEYQLELRTHRNIVWAT